MAGVPHHAASAYVQRLLDQGFKVAICEQMADPSKVKGIVPREVVRVATPGIAYDEAGLEPRQNHYLVAVERGAGAEADGEYGVASLDFSTGEFGACAVPDKTSLVSELVRLAPREVLVGPGAAEAVKALQDVQARAVVRGLGDELSDAEAEEALDAQLGAGEARASCPSAVARRAAARTSPPTAASLRRGAGRCRWRGSRSMPWAILSVLDEATQRHLELVRSVDGGERGSSSPRSTRFHDDGAWRIAPWRRLLAPLANVAPIPETPRCGRALRRPPRDAPRGSPRPSPRVETWNDSR